MTVEVRFPYHREKDGSVVCFVLDKNGNFLMDGPDTYIDAKPVVRHIPPIGWADVMGDAPKPWEMQPGDLAA